ncbi:sigma-54-dependent transcriptional regulator [Halodesulfovibrio marinisediminis]|uniref:Two-component system, NtrC family, response regulator n=1 Tax=Halodesulfovibrio marinisediminis DSM 17456 TaxID=1121457 RepID=A0A1N6ECI8_9BACT|nr:sigma-54 dependent transcriptional regulator [Halodesulfovibrio marinisediminis]SIN80755.1 two-component system, NtrC family, response regulator [Halodesulfovibrio marinisediminis DSM 17456]
MAHVLIVDDDIPTCQFLSELILTIGHTAEVAHSLTDGIEKGLAANFDVVFLDVKLPDGSGLDLLPRLRDLSLPPEVVIMTGQGDPGGVELAIRNGAWDYLQKPLSPKKFLLPLKRVLQYRDNLAASANGAKELNRSGIVGSSFAVKSALRKMRKAAQSDAAVLLTGETGTGKELFARALHENSSRANSCFITVDCAAIPDNLIESTLFGHVRGAFTGAEKASNGLVREADGGTLFLDEIGELPLESQRKFLRVLQEKCFRPVGGKDEVYSNFRLVAATNRSLDSMVEDGRFRRDLLYRLQTMTLSLPPLRERKEDISELVDFFNKKIAARYNCKPKRVASELVDMLCLYEWTGNVRELYNSIESAFVAAIQEPDLFPRHLPERIRMAVLQSKFSSIEQVDDYLSASAEDRSLRSSASIKEPLPYKEFKQEALAALEKQYLQDVMQYAHWDIRAACQVTGLGRSRLYSLLKKNEISR